MSVIGIEFSNNGPVYNYACDFEVGIGDKVEVCSRYSDSLEVVKVVAVNTGYVGATARVQRVVSRVPLRKNISDIDVFNIETIKEAMDVFEEYGLCRSRAGNFAHEDKKVCVRFLSRKEFIDLVMPSKERKELNKLKDEMQSLSQLINDLEEKLNAK